MPSQPAERRRQYEQAKARAAALEIDPDILRKLRPAAAKRDTSVARLVREIIDRVVEDDLVGAVLDD